MSFSKLVLLILRGHKFGIQNALNKVFTELNEVFDVPTKSAYSQARQKLKPEVFSHLNEIVTRDFYQLYEEDGLVKRWHGHRLLGCDGTYITVPDNAELRREFTLQTNQHEGTECVQALCVVLYDLLNDLCLSSGMGKRQGEKKLLFSTPWDSTEKGDVLVLDRHYADYMILAKAIKEGRDVVVRLPRRRFTEAMGFWESGERERIVMLQAPLSARKSVEEEELAQEIEVRLIRVELETGEIEVLVTTLLDIKSYPAESFKAVYGYRWNEETYFDRIKNVFELERFSGVSVRAVKQDFYGVLFLSSLESVLSKRAAEALSVKSKKRSLKDELKVNRAVSYVSLVERVVVLLLSDMELELVLEELHHLFQTNPTPVRKGRHEERRKEMRYARRLRFHKYTKKIIA